MHLSLLSRLFSACTLFLFLAAATFASVTTEEFSRLLPVKVGDYKAAGAVQLKFKEKPSEINTPRPADQAPAATRIYVSPKGEKLEAQLFRTQSDSAAYSLLSYNRFRHGARAQAAASDDLEGIGMVALGSDEGIFFYKGAAFVIVKSSSATERVELVNFARSLAGLLDEGSGEIPVLVKHLPDWEQAEGRAVYAVTQHALKEFVPNQPVLDAVSFEGGTEAVTATYEGGARLVVVEYATPQLAFDGDAAVVARIAGLRGEGQPVPSAYKRIGNYGVFVFDAPNEQAASALVDKVTYEKDVRWLGENPHAVERANRAWLNMSTSVIVNTVKATGLAIVICLTIGGVFGGWIFMRRRAQAALTEKFSDAGGMLRLNIDELSAQNNPARLIGQGDEVR